MTLNEAKAQSEGYTKGFDDGYRKGYQDGLKELLANIDPFQVDPTPDVRTEIGKIKDDISCLESRVKKLERAFYGC